MSSTATCCRLLREVWQTIEAKRGSTTICYIGNRSSSITISKRPRRCRRLRRDIIHRRRAPCRWIMPISSRRDELRTAERIILNSPVAYVSRTMTRFRPVNWLACSLLKFRLSVSACRACVSWFVCISLIGNLIECSLCTWRNLSILFPVDNSIFKK